MTNMFTCSHTGAAQGEGFNRLSVGGLHHELQGGGRVGSLRDESRPSELPVKGNGELRAPTKVSL